MIKSWVSKHSEFLIEKHNVQARLFIENNELYVSFIIDNNKVVLPISIILPSDGSNELLYILNNNVITICANWIAESYIDDLIFKKICTNIMEGGIIK